MAQQESRDKELNNSKETGISAKMWLRTFLVFALFPAVILFGSAGTFEWPMAWLYIVISAATFAISRWIVWKRNPELLKERGQMMDHENTASFDRVLAPLLALAGPILIGLTAGFAIRFNWEPVFPDWVQWMGVAILLLGYVFGSWALVENRFFSTVVRIQNERNHQVITTGPYAIVRHPGYLGAGFGYIGMVLMLGSPWALIPYLFVCVVIVIRTRLEDQLLQNKLQGYNEYARQTRFRLLPGIW